MRIPFSRLIVAILVLLMAGPAATWAQDRKTIEADPANVEVIDGDTLQVNGTVLQLYGIDAPELGQACRHNRNLWHCGIDAALALRKVIILERSPVRCRSWDGDGPLPVYVCEAGRVDLAKHLLETGSVTALPGTFPDYMELEKNAKRSGLGLWRGDFVPPADWRAGTRLGGEGHPPEELACVVKGVVDARGDRYYLVPTDPDHADRVVSMERGEKCFTSDEQARAAGWHHKGERLS